MADPVPHRPRRRPGRLPQAGRPRLPQRPVELQPQAKVAPGGDSSSQVDLRAGPTGPARGRRVRRPQDRHVQHAQLLQHHRRGVGQLRRRWWRPDLHLLRRPRHPANRISNDTCEQDAVDPITGLDILLPGPRGAATQVSFERQEAKELEAINTMDADVVSLEEVENSVKLYDPAIDGPGHPDANRDDALIRLVEQLNLHWAAAHPSYDGDRWAYVPVAAPRGAADPAGAGRNPFGVHLQPEQGRDRGPLADPGQLGALPQRTRAARPGLQAPWARAAPTPSAWSSTTSSPRVARPLRPRSTVTTRTRVTAPASTTATASARRRPSWPSPTSLRRTRTSRRCS